MNLKFYFFSIVIILGMNLNSHAQVSYNKRAIGSIGAVPKAGDFLNGSGLDNVDMATGTLKVGIPLYEIKVNDISVPISLNYSALGLKVGQEAGVTGMGWELSAGGKIITNIQGKKDEVSPGGIQGNPLPDVQFLDPFNNATHKDVVNKIIDNKVDGAWDVYNYILPNGGGSYVKNGLTFPYDPLITIQHPSLIKTTDGVLYNFASGGKKKSTKRIYYETASLTPTPVPDDQQWSRDPGVEYGEWDLESIISAKFKDTVFFNYTLFNRPNAKLPPKTKITTSESLPLYRDVKARSYTDGGILNDANDQYYIIKEPIISQSKTEVLTHTRISNISFPNGNVTFVYGSDILGRDVLDSVNIYQKINNVSTLLKKYIFEYDSNISYGHYLNAIHIYDSKRIWQGAWDFTYYGKLPVIPTIENRAQDRWGFYNGKTTNKTLLDNPDSVLALKIRPHYPIVNNIYNISTKYVKYTRLEATEIYGFNINNDPTTGLTEHHIDFANRKFDFNYAILGTLKSIKTPTGGSFEYEYEPHKLQYLNRPTITQANLDVIAGGGIRVKSITKKLGHENMYYGYSNEEKISKKRYKYGDGAFSGSYEQVDTAGYGIVTIPGNVLSNISAYYERGGALQGKAVNNIMLLSHPVNNMSQYKGSYALYRTVTEYPLNVNFTQASYGKTVYYSIPIPDGARSDALWRSSSTLEDPSLPNLYVNPGVEREFASGVTGVKKYAYTRDATYRLVEETNSYFKSYDAPLTGTNKLVSFFGTLTGQMSGPYPVPTGPPILMDNPYEATRGGTIVNLFNATNTSGTGGAMMDYLARTNIIDETNTINYPGKYATALINLNTLSNCIRKESERTSIGSDNEGIVQIVDTKYYYDNMAHLLPSRIVTVSSLGDSTINRIKYPQDYSNDPAGGSATLDFMRTNKLGLSEPVEEQLTYKSTKAGSFQNNEYLKSAAINTFKELSGSVFTDKIYKMKINTDVSGYIGYIYKGGNVDTNRYTPQLSYDSYIKGNVHKYTELAGPGNVILWGYRNQYPIAKVSNANNTVNNTSSDVAYTSFENRDSGNWTYSGAPLADRSSPSGKSVYSLALGSITKSNTTTAGRYLISYWYKTGAVVNISGGTIGGAVIKNAIGSWSMAEREVSSITGTITVSGTGSIDELRFHPFESQMTTYLYEPLIGLTCTIDPKGNAQFYEYDNFQRLRNIRDQKGNLVKSYRYNMGTLN